LANLRIAKFTKWGLLHGDSPIRKFHEFSRSFAYKRESFARLLRFTREKAASVHSLRVVSGLKTGAQPDLAPETNDPICVMREGNPSIDGTGRG
jgi:hypothetical protein